MNLIHRTDAGSERCVTGRRSRATYFHRVRSGARLGPQMGFNPFRPQRKTTADLVMVAAALAVTIGVVLWAFLAG